MITAAIAYVLANLPLLAAYAGPAGVIAGIAAKFSQNARAWFIFGAIALGAVTVAGAAVHYANLRNAAAELSAITPKIAALERALGCPARSPDERVLFACVPARDRDIDAARAATLAKQQEASARAADALQRKSDRLAADLAESDALIDAAADADDGPVPKVMLDNWARERKARGLQ